ncbi:hypothetical protein TBR22_A19220 [Luteitalea sp. TBR-22]|uniref:hypothetical protein n=1 Tax=Luteitalea sp. TBR-22 TaxID=2802971 RepID=UPI001AFC1FA1|nr:hypothetical protein [Luteitalea sp. TBR-22]BCS32700.1 hypothetical protein TBR22_A19220 [Luteitalea sp. TBR-22]
MLLALAHTWPLVTAPATLSRTDSADGLLNQWILGWVAHALATQPLSLFDANIFFPEPRTLAFSEHLVVPALFSAPVFWAGGGPVLAYNVTLWIGLALTGWTMALVVHRWTGDWYAALLAGSLAAFNTDTLTRMAHIQAMHVEFLPLALLALDDTLRSGSRRDALRLGLYAALQMLCSGYLLVMTGVSLAVGVLVRPRDWLGARARTVLPSLALAIGVMALLCAPFLLQYYRVQQDQGLTRSVDEVRQYAGAWANFVATGARVHYETWNASLYRQANSAAFPGVTPWLLALVAVGAGIAWRDPRARTWLAIGLVGAALSFGPELPGYAVLYRVVPILQGIRAVARFALLPLLAVGVLGAFGLAWLRTRLEARGAGRAAHALGVAAVVLVNVENTRVPMGFVEFDGIPAMYQALAREPNAIVAELPFPEPARVAVNAAAVQASTAHWKPLLNGYSGYTPRSYVDHYLAFQGFPGTDSIDALRRAGVTHIVVHVGQAPDAVAALQKMPAVTLLASDTERRIYRIR